MKKGDDGNTPLHQAVIEGDDARIAELLKKGGNPLPNQWGITPVHLTQYLDRTNRLTPPKTKSILVYSNRDEKVHPIPIEEFEERLKITYTDSLIFDSIDTINKVAKKCARKLKKKKFHQMNDWTLALHKKAMESCRDNLHYIRWINRYLGYGVFSACDIPALSYIGEYTGVINRRNNRKNRYNDYVFSYDLCGKATRWCINAKERGNFTRFLNHSDRPNLTSRWVIKDGVTHIILFANKLIPKDTQLTYCYGPWYWRSRTSPSSL